MDRPGLASRPSTTPGGGGSDGNGGGACREKESPVAQPLGRTADPASVHFYRTPHESHTPHLFRGEAALADLPSPPSPEDLGLGDRSRQSTNSTGNSSRLITPTSANVPQFTSRMRRRHGSRGGHGTPSMLRSPTTAGAAATNSSAAATPTHQDSSPMTTTTTAAKPASGRGDCDAGSPNAGSTPAEQDGDSGNQFSPHTSRESSQQALPRPAHRAHHRAGSSGATLQRHHRHGETASHTSASMQSAASSAMSTPAQPNLYGSTGLFATGGRHATLPYGNAAAVAATAAGHHGHFLQYAPVYVSVSPNANTPTSSAKGASSPTGSQSRSHRRVRGNTVGISASAQAWHWGPSPTSAHSAGSSTTSQQQPQFPPSSQVGAPRHRHTRHGGVGGRTSRSGTQSRGGSADRRKSRAAPASLFASVPPTATSLVQPAHSDASTIVSSPATATSGGVPPRPTPTSSTSHSEARHAFPRHHPAVSPHATAAAAFSPVSHTSSRDSASFGHAAAPDAAVEWMGSGSSGDFRVNVPPMSTIPVAQHPSASSNLNDDSSSSHSPTTTTTTTTTTAATPPLVTPTTEFERSLAHVPPPPLPQSSSSSAAPRSGSQNTNMNYMSEAGGFTQHHVPSFSGALGTYGEPQHPVTMLSAETISSMEGYAPAAASAGGGAVPGRPSLLKPQSAETHMKADELVVDPEHLSSVGSPMTPPSPHRATPQPFPTPSRASHAPPPPPPPPPLLSQHFLSLPQSQTQGIGHALSAPRSFATAAPHASVAEPEAQQQQQQQLPPPPPPPPSRPPAGANANLFADHLSTARGGAFLSVSNLGSGEESTLYSLNHSTPNSYADSPPPWDEEEEPLGVMGRAYTSTEAQMALYQQRLNDARIQDALQSLGIGGAATTFSTATTTSNPSPDTTAGRTGVVTATVRASSAGHEAGQPSSSAHAQQPSSPSSSAAAATTAAAAAMDVAAASHVLANNDPRESTVSGPASMSYPSAAEALIDWGRAYACGQPGNTSAATAAAAAVAEYDMTAGGVGNGAHPAGASQVLQHSPNAPFNDLPRGFLVATPSADDAFIREEAQQQQQQPSIISACELKSSSNSGLLGHQIFRSSTAPSAVAAMAADAAAADGGGVQGASRRAAGTGAGTVMFRDVLNPASPPTPGSNTDTFGASPSPPRAAAAAAAAAAGQPDISMGKSLQYASSSAFNSNSNVNASAGGLNSSMANMNTSALFYLNSSFNASTMRDALAASVAMQHNRTALIAELKRRRQRLQKQLAALQKEATARNIFALVRASNASQVQYLLQQGLCSVTDRDYNGCTPLHVAAGEGNQTIVRVLLSFGADVLAVDHSGRTPLDCAAANRHSGVGRYLLTVIRNKHLAQASPNSETDDTATGVEKGESEMVAHPVWGVGLPDAPPPHTITATTNIAASSAATAETGSSLSSLTLSGKAGGGLRRDGSGWVGTPDLLGGSFIAWTPTPYRTPQQHEKAREQSEAERRRERRSPFADRCCTLAFPDSGSECEVSPSTTAAATTEQKDEKNNNSSDAHQNGADAEGAGHGEVVKPLPTLSLSRQADPSNSSTSTSLSVLAQTQRHPDQPPPPSQQQQQQQQQPSSSSSSLSSPARTAKSETGDAAAAASAAVQWRHAYTPHGSPPMRPVVLSPLHSSAAARSRVWIAAESLSGTTGSLCSTANSSHPTRSAASTPADVAGGPPSMHALLPPSHAAARAAATTDYSQNTMYSHDDKRNGNDAAASSVPLARSVGSSRPTSPAAGSSPGNAQTNPKLSWIGAAVSTGVDAAAAAAAAAAAPERAATAGGRPVSMLRPASHVTSSAPTSTATAATSDAEYAGSTPPTQHDRPVVSAPPYLTRGMVTPLSEGGAAPPSLDDHSDPATGLALFEPHNGLEGVRDSVKGSAQACLAPSIPSASFDNFTTHNGNKPPISMLRGSSMGGELDNRHMVGSGPTSQDDVLSEAELSHVLLSRHEVITRQKHVKISVADAVRDTSDSRDGQQQQQQQQLGSRGGSASTPMSFTPPPLLGDGGGDGGSGNSNHHHHHASSLHDHFHDGSTRARGPLLKEQQQQQRQAGSSPSTSTGTAAETGVGLTSGAAAVIGSGSVSTKDVAASAAALGVAPGTRMLRPLSILPVGLRDKPSLLFPVDGSTNRSSDATSTAITTALAGSSGARVEVKSPEDEDAPVKTTIASGTGSLHGAGSYTPSQFLQHDSLSVHDVGQQSLEEHRRHFQLTATTGAKVQRRVGWGAVNRSPGNAPPLLQAGRNVMTATTGIDDVGTASSSRNNTCTTNCVKKDGNETVSTTTAAEVFAAAAATTSTQFDAIDTSALAATSNIDDDDDEDGDAETDADVEADLDGEQEVLLPEHDTTGALSNRQTSLALLPPKESALAQSDVARAPPSGTAAAETKSKQDLTGSDRKDVSASPQRTDAQVPPPRSTGRHAAEEQQFLEQGQYEPLDLATLHHSSYTTVCDTVSIIVCMVGLPGRGKSFIGKRLVRYMNWKGVPCRVFNAGNYRRQLLGVEGTAGADFFDPNNPKGAQLREKMAELACEDLVRFIASHALAVGILDATNTTRKRRTWLSEYFQREAGKRGVPYRLLFIESVCTDDTIITENILRSKCDNDDFKNVKDVGAIIAEFRSRILQYEKVYETCEPAERMPYIKIINVKHHVLLHHVPNGLGSRIAFFLLNLHPIAFPIYVALPGETVGDKKHTYGGEERLTARGEAYAVALKNFIQDRYVPHMVVLHATNYSVLSTLAPLMDGAMEDETALILQVSTTTTNNNNNNNKSSSSGSPNTTGSLHPAPAAPPQQQPAQASRRAPPPPPMTFTSTPITSTTTSTHAGPSPTNFVPSSASVSVVVATPTGAAIPALANRSLGADPLSPAQQGAPTAQQPPSSTTAATAQTSTSESPTSDAPSHHPSEDTDQRSHDHSSASSPHRHRQRSRVFPTKRDRHRSSSHADGDEEEEMGKSRDSSNASGSGGTSHRHRHQRHHQHSKSSSRSRRSHSCSSSCRHALPNTEAPVSKLHPYAPTTTVEQLRAMAGGDLSLVPLPQLRAFAVEQSVPRDSSNEAVSPSFHAVHDDTPTAIGCPGGDEAEADTEGATVRVEETGGGSTRQHDSAQGDDDATSDAGSSSSSSSSSSGSDSGSSSENEETCDEVLCPVPGLDNINYGRFSGHTAAWVKEKYPRLSAILYDIAEEEPTTNSGTAAAASTTTVKGKVAGQSSSKNGTAVTATAGTGTGTGSSRATAAPPAPARDPPTAEEDGNGSPARGGGSGVDADKSAGTGGPSPSTLPGASGHGAPNDWLAATLPPPVHYATHEEAVAHLQHAPTGVDPRLSYCIQFPNGESCRQVNVRLEPALMAVMRTQSPVFVVAPPVPAQGVLAFFMDVIPELSPTLRIPGGCIVEIGVKDGITVHPLLPDSLPESMTRSPLTVLPELQDAMREVAAASTTSAYRNAAMAAVEAGEKEPGGGEHQPAPTLSAAAPGAAAATTTTTPVS